jgi:signal transduction histidine kinase
MNMSIGKKMGLGFGILLALMATLDVVVLMHIDNMHRQFASVIQHDAPAIANARHLLKLVVDMETGQRGFVITGKQEFLEPYESGRIEFANLIRTEKTLVSDNPSQLQRLAKIEASVQEWETKAAQPEIAMRRKAGVAKVDAQLLQEILSQGEGKRIADRFMELGHEIEVFFTDRGDWEGAFAVEIIEKCMTDRESSQRGFLITGQEEFLEKYSAGEQKNLPIYFSRLRALISEKGHENLLSGKIDQLEQLATEWNDKSAEPEISARRKMNNHSEMLQDVTAMVEIGPGKRILDRIRTEFQLFIDDEKALMAQRFTAATLTANTATRTTIVLTLVSLIVGGVMALMITLGITKPVHRLAEALSTVAKGDLRQKIEIKTNDEIGKLSQSFNQMMGDLKQLNEGRKRDEQALRGAKEYTDNIIKSLSDMLVVVAPDGSIISINEATSRLLGYEQQELIGEPATLLFSHQDEEEADVEDEDAPRTLSQRELPLKKVVLRSLLKEGHFNNIEKNLLAKDGRTIPSLLSGALMWDEQGDIRGIVCVARDITERTKAEEETRNLQTQLRHAQKMDAIGQLATGVAHEFNNALVGIRGNAELVLNMPGTALPDAIRQPLKDIERSGVRAYEITQQLLSFARKKNHHATVFDVTRMVLDSHQMLQRLIGTQITLTTRLDADPAYVRADESELEQALMNLVINARDAMPSGGGLSIRTCVATLEGEGLPQHCKAGRFVQLSVADDGCGMSPETVERIFEPFFTTKSVGKGTGLGLSTVYSDIANSGGFVSVQSQQGKGTVIDVHLPLSKQSALVETAEAGPSSIAAASGGETILVCDDEEIVLASVSALLKSVGYRVIATNSGKEALEAAEAYAAEISLLITDLTMPDMDGVELGNEIHRQHPEMKIIYSSGHAADYVELCAENNRIEILEKGRSSNEMFRRIRAVLDKDDPDDTTISRKAG